MPFADWLKRIMAEKAQDFLVAPLDETHGAPRRAAVRADAEYVTLRIKAARIVDVRRWTTRFHGCINSRARLLHEGGGSIEHQTVLAPAQLKEVDPTNVDRIVSIDKVLLGPFPYRGQLDLTVALFTVKSTDLAAPYLELLTSLADIAGVAFPAGAKPYVEPLQKGADLLFGTAGASQLEIGFDRDFTALEAGFYLAMRAPKHAVALDQLRIDPKDFRLIDGSGQPFGSYPYFILSIERGVQRPDWMLIPDLKATWDAIRQAFVGAQYIDAGNLLDQFGRQCRVSPHLVLADAKRLEKKARDMFRTQLLTQGHGPFTAGPPTTFGGDRSPQPFPEFEALDLYG
jgi:hypothetical protein